MTPERLMKTTAGAAMRKSLVVSFRSSSSKPTTIRRATTGAATSRTIATNERERMVRQKMRLDMRQSSSLLSEEMYSLKTGTKAELTIPPTEMS